eukprot:jgi/Ulvmu1/1591/UM111_0019.1
MAAVETKLSPGHIPQARQHDLRLRERFQLPEYESCIEHFSCAYSSKILRQGHIYVMLRHVCFTSTVFPTPVKIHAADIKSVLPKSNLFLPNSIEIVENNGTKHFFTSFLSRERCLELIISRWQTELARAADTVPLATAPAGHDQDTSDSPPEEEPGTQQRSTSTSMRRRGWPLSPAPPPDPTELASSGWTNVLDQALQGWEVFDVIKIFEDDDNFFQDWHDSLGDTDVKIEEWKQDEEGDRAREVVFTARIHDPPIGSSRTVKVVASQRARLHSDGTFSADLHNTMPLITVAKFRVEFLWRISQAGGRAHVLVWVRAHFLRPSILRATISSQSVSQGISCYTQLKQRLVLRFPPQGSRPDQRDHASDVAFALRIAKDASARMPRAWQEHLLSSLSERPAVAMNAFASLIRYGSSAAIFVLVALVATFIVLPSINLKLQPPHAALREHLDVLAATLQPLNELSLSAPRPPPSAAAGGHEGACRSVHHAWEPGAEQEAARLCEVDACAGADSVDCPGERGRCGQSNCSAEQAGRDASALRAVAPAHGGGEEDLASQQDERDTIPIPRYAAQGKGWWHTAAMWPWLSRGEGGSGSGAEAEPQRGWWRSYEEDEEDQDSSIEMQLLEVVQRERRLLEAVMRRRKRAAIMAHPD